MTVYKNMCDEGFKELINSIFPLPTKDNPRTYTFFDSGIGIKTELLSRLKEGEKAIKKLEKLEEIICRGAPLMWAKGEYIEEAGNWERECMSIIRE